MKDCSELLAENLIIEYVAPISQIQEKVKTETGANAPMKIKGIAIDESVSYNNIKYTAEELKKAAPSLADKPILKDHQNECDALVGRTTISMFDEKCNGVGYEGLIMDKGIKEKIADGRIKNVSISAKVDKLYREDKKNDDSPLVAEGISFLELTITPVQGVRNATISQAITEKLKGDLMADEKEEEKKEETEDKPEEKPEEKPEDKPKEKEEEKPAEPDKPAEASTESMKKMLKEVVKEELKALKEKPKSKGIVSSSIKTEKVEDELIRERTPHGLNIYSLDERLIYGDTPKTIPEDINVKG